ncbi:LOW QUALITY PROTEIN: hypothetical protein Cgig2_016526 [Carnegiea gigantea]|uniref:Uncharacterized protein n=1 Tax=Carnegiea gigantea TaxID=171969 RepID=A0A9Q1JZA4_9CARY|nr:LOW QUALITY PROTEIN: hypothetical protein Cgig2_016526 [Carnegiea gigantea]
MGSMGKLIVLELRHGLKDYVMGNSDVIFYILGSHSPLPVMEGHVKRIWGENVIDNILKMDNPTIIVRFYTVSGTYELLHKSVHYFGKKKPMIVKQWDIGMDTKYQYRFNFPHLHPKSWGVSKEASLLGRPIMAYKATSDNTKLNFERVLVEVYIAKPLPKWKSKRYNKCKMFGHLGDNCHEQVRREWWRKETTPAQEHFVLDINVEQSIGEEMTHK